MSRRKLVTCGDVVWEWTFVLPERAGTSTGSRRIRDLFFRLVNLAQLLMRLQKYETMKTGIGYMAAQVCDYSHVCVTVTVNGDSYRQ